MGKRAYRLVWGLAVVLAVVLLGGGSVLLAHWQNGLPDEKKWLVLLPRNKWGFGQLLIASHSPERRKPNPFRIGFLGVRVKAKR